MILSRLRHVFIPPGFQKIDRHLWGKVAAGRNRPVAAEQQGIEQMIVVAAEHGEVRVSCFDGMDHAAQVGNGVDGVFDADDVAARIGQGFDQRRGQILPGQRREVIEHHRQRDAVRHLLEIADQVRFRHFPVVRVDHHDAVRPRLLRVLAERNGFPRVGAAGADKDRHATIDMIDSKLGNGFTLFGAELGELAAAAKEEQAVNACFDEIVDQRGGALLIELAIGGKNGGDRGNDSREQRGLRHEISLLNHDVLHYRTAFIKLTIIL